MWFHFYYSTGYSSQQMWLDELDYNFIKACQGNVVEVQNCMRHECRENEYISLYIIMLQKNQGNQNKTEDLVDPYLVLLRCQLLFQILRERSLANPFH